MSEIVIMSDPRVIRIPVAECGEPLIDLRGCGELLLDGRLAPLELQVRYFADYSDELRGGTPTWSEQHLHTQTSRSLSPPEIGPHVAGAAIDLTLCTADGVELDMGTAVNES